MGAHRGAIKGGGFVVVLVVADNLLMSICVALDEEDNPSLKRRF